MTRDLWLTNMQDFKADTEKLLLLFEEVFRDRSSPHFDDAAYFLGWLQYHLGNLSEALAKFEFAIAPLPKIDAHSANGRAGFADDGDYHWAAVRQTARILRTLLPEESLSRVKYSKVLSTQPTLWYTV